jgi:hypothetical protein
MTDVRSGSADYRPMTESTLAPYLAGLAEVAAFPGAAPQDWRISEDGNLNPVFTDRYRRPGSTAGPRPSSTTSPWSSAPTAR